LKKNQVIEMEHVKYYQCTLCNKVYDKKRYIFTCPSCGEHGILDVIYDYASLRHILTESYFRANLDFSIWRYLPILSVLDRHTDETLRVGWTPLYDSKHLREQIHLRHLYIKDEGLNPTGSLKDRASVIAVLKALEARKHIVSCSSTGNAASSLAGNAAKMGLKSVIFVPKRAPIGKLTQLQVYGSTLITVDGDYKDAFSLSKKAISHFGWYNRNAAINPHLVEGKKTVAFEIAEQLHFRVPDWVVVSVGDGCTIAGVYKGFYDFHQIGLIHKIPKLLGVQAEGCSPFVDAVDEERLIRESAENTIADSIAVGIPRNPIKALRAVSESLGAWVKVSDQAIMDAMFLMGKAEGIFAEPAASASLAGVIEAKRQGIIKEKDSVVVISTGNGLKDVKNATDHGEKPVLMKPDLSELIEYMNAKEKSEENYG